MPGRETYAERLRGIKEWRTYLVTNSGLPGPRGNIELAQAVADLGTARLFRQYLDLDDDPRVPDPEKEYLVFCAVLGLGRLVADGERGHLDALRRYASDPRWRVREAVAMALQRFGVVDMDLLLRTAKKWLKGGWLEQRAVAAGLCEPALLHDLKHVDGVLDALDAITAGIADAEDRTTDAFRALRKGMGYCWSVAAAASPGEGKRRMERWMSSADADVRWIMKENLGKNRLVRIDPAWAETWRSRLSAKKGSLP
jgi:hypothetical protein